MSSDDKESGCMAPLLGLVIGVPLALWNSWVMTVLWGWFAVPQFGVRPLSMPVAYGILLLAGMMHPTPNTTKEQRERGSTERVIEILVLGAFTSTLSLLLGWLAHQFQ